MAHNEIVPFNAKAFVAKYGGAPLARYPARSILYSQGDAADCVFYIQHGNVRLSVVSEQGKEAILAILDAGQLCGEGCLNGEPLRISTATTMGECVIARLEKASIVRALHEDPIFSDYFISYLLTQNLTLKQHLIDHLFSSSEQRLARALLLLANYGKEPREEKVIAKIDQMTLAQMVGTTRARVSHFMNKFRRMGFIEYNGEIRVHSSLLNVILHDQPNGIRALRSAKPAYRTRLAARGLRRDTGIP